MVKLRGLVLVASAIAFVPTVACRAPESSTPAPESLRVGTPGTARWSSPLSLSIVPVSAANMTDGRVLFWSAESRMSFGGSGQTYTVVFDPSSMTASEQLVTSTGHDMFCPGTAILPDGRVLVNGGLDSGKTSLFDPAAGTWATGPAMKITRGYNASAPVYDGSIFTLGGSWSGGSGGKNGEVWTAASGWRLLSGVPIAPFVTADSAGMYRADNHMWLLSTGSGRLLHVGPSRHMNWIDTAGFGTTTSAGDRSDDTDSMCGNAVMYDVGKILKVGGSTDYQDVDANANAYVIDVTRGASVRKLAPMAYARAFHNSVVLPNGQVVVLGGQTRPVPFSDDRSVLVPELWDPTTEHFTALPAMASPRNYHSVALLLLDGTVLSAGGGLCGDTCAGNHPDLQILTPPYLLNQDGSLAARPVIASAPAQVAYGASPPVTTTGPVSSFVLMRMGSTTHTVNNDQRRIPLTFQSTGANTYTLSIPTNPGIAVPGPYMLFALDADGVPSVAKVVKLDGSATPRLVPPGDQTGSVGTSASLTLSAGTGAITYGATGLPPGLTVAPATGVISGTPTAAGTYPATVTAANANGTVSFDLTWTITGSGPTGSAIRYVKLEELTEINGNPWGSMAELNVLDAASKALPRTGWTVTADSQELVGENGAATNAIDGNINTFWHTQWFTGSPVPPHSYLVDLGAPVSISGFQYLPRQDGQQNGTIAQYRFSGSPDGTTWSVLAQGTFTGGTANQTVTFPPTPAPGPPPPPTNHAPVVTKPSDQATTIGQSVSLAIAATDPDADALTFTAQGLPAGLTIAAATGVITGSPTTVGTYSVTVTAQDGKGGSGSASFGWSVSAPPTTIQPVLAPPAQAGSTVSYTATVTGLAPTLSWSFGDGSPATPASAATTTTHVFAAPGLYTVTLTVQTADANTTTRTFTQAIVPAPVAGRAASSANVAFGSATGNGGLLWVANPDANTVTAFDLTTATKKAEIAVGAFPATLAAASDGKIWVTNRNDATISVIDPATSKVASTIALPRSSQPFGIVFSPVDGSAFVALEATGQLLKIDTLGNKTPVAVGPRPRHVAIDAAGTRVLVSRFITPRLPGENTATVDTSVAGAEVVVVAASSLTVQSTVVLHHGEKADSAVQARGIPNYLGAAAISPDGASAWVPSKQDNVKRGKLRDGNDLDFQDTVRAITSRVDLASLAEDLPSRVDHDNSGVASAAAFHPSGAYLFVALETSRQVGVIDPFRHAEILRFDAGRAPQGLAVSPDGLRLYVSNFMDRSVSVFDLTRVVNYGEATVPLLNTLAAVATEKLSAQVLLGKQLFYDARDTRLARDGYLSCASCHRDGDGDGRVWDFTGFGEGLRNTIALAGRAGMGNGPLHWSGNFDEVQDFEGQIRSLARGTGLMTDAAFATGTRNQPLGDAKAGVSADLDALAAYVASLTKFANSPKRNADGTLTAAATAGKTVFAAQCTSCHGADALTTSALGNLQNVGTIKPTSGSRLGGPLTGIDIPTLRDAWATAPYLHDGSAATIGDAIRAHTGVSFDATTLANVEAYVAQLGGEEPGFSKSVQARYVKLEEVTEWSGQPWASMAELNITDANGVKLSRTGWAASADSVELVGENGAVANAIDGKNTTIWHTQWKTANPTPPHWIVLDMKTTQTIGGFRYLPRQDGNTNGSIAKFRFWVSSDGVNWGSPVVTGDFKTMGSATAEKVVTLK